MFKKYKKPLVMGNGLQENQDNNNLAKKETVAPPPAAADLSKSLQFYCQLAHGSPMGVVSGFNSVRDLYCKIADKFDMPATEILFCTLNTYKIDMTKLLGGQIGLEDIIFAHRKGRPKEVELKKSEPALGLTITDNGAGYAFIKRIKDGSVIHSIPHIQVGDHIEKLNEVDMVGKRHFEVAKALKEIPLNATFTVRLIEPMKTGFTSIAPKGSGKTGKKNGYGTGRETLRFKGGQAQIEEKDDALDAGIEKINSVLENFMGINDSELATQIWEMAENKTNSMDFADAIDESELAAFQFDDDIIIEIWGIVTDVRQGRIKKKMD